jgi:hypothetical protein
MVEDNVVNNTGGFSDPAGYTNGVLKSVTLISYSQANSPTNLLGTVPDFGSGVYINAGTSNMVVSNTIGGNALAGIYVFQDGATLSNTIQSNTLMGQNFGYTKGLPWNGDYGILLFDSSGDLSNVSLAKVSSGGVGVILSGTGSNTFLPNPGPSSFRIANFREYTGPAQILPSTVVPSSSTISSSKIKPASVSIASVSQTVKVTTGKKGLPLPPVMKSSTRKK